MKVGIVGAVTGFTVGVPYNYMDYIRRYFHAYPIILLPDSDIVKDLDLLILPGGADVSSLRYGEIPIYDYSPPDLMKEYFDTVILPVYISLGIPVFGICRGLQTLNVHFGGTLHQDMYHETNTKEDPYKAVHKVKVSESNRIFGVNSRHHQAIRILGDGLEVLATYESKSSSDKTIEAIKHKELRVLGVQWHPEDLYDRDANIWLSGELNKIMKK